MDILIDPFNAALFEFEEAMDKLESAYTLLRAQFDLTAFNYLRMKRNGATETSLCRQIGVLTRIHTGMQRHGLNLKILYDEHRYLIKAVEDGIRKREAMRGSL